MKKRTTRNIGIYVLIFALVMGMAFLYNRAPRDESKEIEYSELVEYIAKEEVKELSVDNNKMVMTAKLKNGEEVKAEGSSPRQQGADMPHVRKGVPGQRRA